MTGRKYKIGDRVRIDPKSGLLQSGWEGNVLKIEKISYYYLYSIYFPHFKAVIRFASWWVEPAPNGLEKAIEYFKNFFKSK